MRKITGLKSKLKKSLSRYKAAVKSGKTSYVSAVTGKRKKIKKVRYSRKRY